MLEPTKVAMAAAPRADAPATCAATRGVLSSGTKYTSAAAAAAASRPAVLSRPGVFLQRQNKGKTDGTRVVRFVERVQQLHPSQAM